MAGCKSVQVGGEITSVSLTDSTVTIGARFKAQGSFEDKLDSLVKGIPVMLGGQWIQVQHTDSTFDINTLLNFKTK
jgi:hypothetical protein